MSSESQISSQPLGVSLYCSLAHATFGMYQKKPEHVLTMYVVSLQLYSYLPLFPTQTVCNITNSDCAPRHKSMLLRLICCQHVFQAAFIA